MSDLKPIHYYSVMTGNRGDMAIRESIIRDIQKRIDVPIAYFNLKYEELTEERILKQLNPDASALIIAGSGLYSNYNKSSGWYFPCKPELFNKIKVPIMLLGIGNNSNLKGNFFAGDLTKKAKESIKLINDLSYVSTVRDKRTYNLLSDIGVNDHQLIPDPANFLNYNFKNKKPKKPEVALSMAQHAPILGRFDGGKEGQKNRAEHIKRFAHIGRYLISIGYSIKIITHDALEQSLALDLKKELPTLKIVNTDDIRQMVYEYWLCDFSIGIRMHSNILSFAAGVPFISLYYDLKSIEYMKLIGWSYSIFGKPVFEDYYKWLKDKVDYLKSNQEVFKSYIQETKEYYKPMFDSLMDKVCCKIKE